MSDNNRLKIADLKAGDTVYIDNGFTCMDAGPKTVNFDEYGEPFLSCDMGGHWLDCQEDEAGYLVGIRSAPYDVTGRTRYRRQR